MTGGLADEDDGLALALESGRHGLGNIRDQADGADGGGGEDASAVGLVVKRDIARDHREIERQTGFAHTLDALDELTHDPGPLRVAEVHGVGDRQGLGPRRRKVPPSFGHRLGGAGEGVCGTVAGCAVDGHGQALVRSVHAHDGGVAAGTLDGVPHHHVIVLLPDPLLGAEIGTGQHGLERRRHAFWFRDIGTDDHRGLGRRIPRPFINRRGVGKRRDGKIGDDFATLLHDHASGVGDLPDDGEVKLPLGEDLSRFVLLFRHQNHQHPFLAFRKHDLISAHARLTGGYAVEIKLDPDPALRRHLEGRTGKSRRAHVLYRHDRVQVHEFEARLDQQFFGEGIADLHRRPFRLRLIVEFGRCHGGAVNPVASGLRAHIDHRIADARGRRIENPVLGRQSHGHGVDQDVAVV